MILSNSGGINRRKAYQIYGCYKDGEYGQYHEWQNQDSNIYISKDYNDGTEIKRINFKGTNAKYQWNMCRIKDD